MGLMQLDGFGIVIDEECFRLFQKKEKRTWRERLFSFPWNPFQAHKIIIERKPNVLVDSCMRVIYCHPDVADEIIAQFSKND